MTARDARVSIALLLEFAALVLLGLVALGRPWPAEQTAAAVYVLTDRSASVPTAELQYALKDLVTTALGTSPLVELMQVDFAGNVGTPRRLGSPADAARMPSLNGLAPDATNLANAIQRASMTTVAPRPVAIVVLSDGNSTTGDTERALEGAASAGIPVLWHTVAPAPSVPRIVEVLAPSSARPGQQIPVIVRLAGDTDQPLRLTISARDDSVEPVAATVAAGPLGSVTLRLQAREAVPLLLDAKLTHATTSRIVDEKTFAAAIDVEPPAEVLYVADGPSALAQSLRKGGWTLTTISPGALGQVAAQFERYAVVILDDVSASVADSAVWDALVGAVRDRGTGLLVLGGEHSFAAGSYRDSRLEAILPVQSRPAALGDAAALAFVVDKSGSMGESVAGVDRFRLAQRAVIDTAATLSERDSAALIVFDVTARNLVPLEIAKDFKQAVAAPWTVVPRGGTRIIPAIEMAIAKLDSAGADRRIIVLVTDGFLDTAPVDALRARLSQARIELIAFAVGPDADADVLARLVDPGRGTILRVGEAAELPALMRDSVEKRRAPVERGRIAVQQRRLLPFLSSDGGKWPAVSAYAVTSPHPDAIVHLESARGDPLLAYRQAGLGRVVAVTAGLGTWTPDWLSWGQWPALAGGLVEWVASSDPAQGLAVSASDLPAGVRVDVDMADDGSWAQQGPAHLRVRAPSGGTSEVPLEASAPGRMSVLLPDPEPGLYTFTVVARGGAQTLMYLHQPRRELGRTGPSPEIGAWKNAGLVRDWSPAELDRLVHTVHASSGVPYRPLVLALLMFLSGVLVDRYRVEARISANETSKTGRNLL